MFNAKWHLDRQEIHLFQVYYVDLTTNHFRLSSFIVFGDGDGGGGGIFNAINSLVLK